MLKGFLSLFLQENCPLCDRKTDQELCIDCQRQLHACELAQPDRFWQADLPLFVWGKYEGKLKQTITSLKYDNHPDLAVYLGQLLAQAWQKTTVYPSKPSFTVIPIPLHPDRQKTRGFNQAALIAQGFCRVTGSKIQTDGIKRISNTPTLFQLSPQERTKALDRAFTLGSLGKISLQKPSILLVDDIYTTGSTAREVAKLLKIHQFPLIGIAAIATSRQR